MVEKIEKQGLFFSGKDLAGERMEIAELSQTTHPFYFGTQFHPEFKSRPNRPSPPFFAFVAVASGQTSELSKAGVTDIFQSSVSSLSQSYTPRKRGLTNESVEDSFSTGTCVSPKSLSLGFGTSKSRKTESL
jgi:hypothetical protein